MSALAILLLSSVTVTAASSCPDGDPSETQDATSARGFFFAVADTSSTEVVTVTSTTTRFVTCTSTEYGVGPCRQGRQRALASAVKNLGAGITHSKSPLRDTKELQLESSLEVSELFPKDHAALRETCNTLTNTDPDGRLILTLERVTFSTQTKTEVVTVRDPRSTVSITYDGCVPPDAIETFECPGGYGYGYDMPMDGGANPDTQANDGGGENGTT
ncbi:uncharacterized protein LOC122260358 [Penaeus japonicus]|uniref:uncharacterized protein LOC122260358 n=1 Tax=Penaeus japonicus TaxID=27405 RepID=UPI001C714775|nr:uncharacterized protein LOC122260358 [Penaeus japonicus]